MMMRRNISTISKFFLAIATLTSFSVSGHAKSSDVASLARADRFFGANASLWKTYIVDPLAKRQAARKLDRLSRSLHDLATEKLELAEALSENNGGGNGQRAKTSIANFKDIVQQLRRDLEVFSEILPDEQRREGVNVARELDEGLTQKWLTLNRAERLIDERGASAEPVVNELRAAVQQVRTLKSKVDNLITDIRTR
jgi:hypothetical protein